MATVTDSSAFTAVQTVDTQTLASAADVLAKIVQPLANRTRFLNDSLAIAALSRWTLNTTTFSGASTDAITHNASTGLWVIADSGSGSSFYHASTLGSIYDAGGQASGASGDGGLATNGTGTILAGFGRSTSSANRIYAVTDGGTLGEDGTAAFVALPASSTNPVRVFWTGSAFLAIEPATRATYASTTGTSSWSTVTSVSVNHVPGVGCWANNGAGSFVASTVDVVAGTGGSERIIYSENNGTTWSTTTVPGTTQQVLGICYNPDNATWYACGVTSGAPQIWSSTNLSSWSAVNPTFPGYTGVVAKPEFRRICVFRGLLVVSCVLPDTLGAGIMVSRNGGLTWFAVASINANDSYAGGIMLATANQIAIFSPSGGHLRNLAYTDPIGF